MSEKSLIGDACAKTSPELDKFEFGSGGKASSPTNDMKAGGGDTLCIALTIPISHVGTDTGWDNGSAADSDHEDKVLHVPMGMACEAVPDSVLELYEMEKLSYVYVTNYIAG